jgi:hypothetical protein
MSADGTVPSADTIGDGAWAKRIEEIAKLDRAAQAAHNAYFEAEELGGIELALWLNVVRAVRDADRSSSLETAMTLPLPARDQHFTNPPNEGLHLDVDQLASLKVLLDFAVPREPGSPTDWEGAGRRYHESIIGYRKPCNCPPPRLAGSPPASGCPVHDPTGDPR